MNASTDDARTDLSGESIAVRTRHMRSAPTEVPTAGGICAFICPLLHLGRPRICVTLAAVEVARYLQPERN